MEQELQNIAAKLFNEKVFLFSEEEIKQFPTLKQEGFFGKANLFVAERIYELDMRSGLLDAIYGEVHKKIAYDLNGDIKELFDFIEEVENYFMDAAIHLGRTHFIRSLRLHLVKKAVLEFGARLAPYLLSQGRNSNSFWEAKNLFISSLEYHEYDSLELYRALKHLASEMYLNGVMDGSWMEIYQNGRDYFTMYPDSANEVYAFSLKDINETKDGASIVSVSNVATLSLWGLVKAGRVSFGDLIKKIDSPAERGISALVLDEDLVKGETAVKEILNALQKVDRSEKPFAFQRAHLVHVAFLANTGDPELSQLILGEMKAILFTSDEEISGVALSKFLSSNKVGTLQIELLKEFIQSDFFREKYMPVISDFFWLSESEPQLFFEVLELIALKLKFKFDAGVFKHSISVLYNIHRAAFDRLLVGILIHEHGYNRWAGHQILGVLVSNYGVRSFSFDLSSLNALEQYKICVSLFLTIYEPKEILPFILPLVYSSSEIVRELLLCKIELMTEDYKNEVVKTMEQYFTTPDAEVSNAINRVKRYFEKYAEAKQRRYQCKELNPLLTQKRILNLYFEHYKIVTDEMQKGAIAGSLMRFTKNVSLTRGGGWKLPNHKEVRKLQSMEVSRIIPIGMFKFPEMSDRDMVIEFTKNWKNEFKKWEQIILL